jgi:hypothetical protein
MKTGNVMIGAVKKATVTEIVRSNINRYSLKDDPYDVASDIGKKYNWSVKKIEQAERVIRKSYINGIGAVKSGRISFDGKRRFFYDDGTLFGDFVGVLSDRSYKKIIADPKNSEIVTTKLKAWAKRNGYRYSKGFDKNKQYGVR